MMCEPQNGVTNSDDIALIDSDIQVDDKRGIKYGKDAIS